MPDLGVRAQRQAEGRVDVEFECVGALLEAVDYEAVRRDVDVEGEEEEEVEAGEERAGGRLGWTFWGS